VQQIPTRRFALVLLKAALFAFIIEAIGEGLWGVFLALNLSSTPTLPWSIVPEGLVLFLLWRYGGGWGPPARTANVRRIYRRANSVPRGLFLKTFVAGVCSIIALGGWWIVLFRLLPTRPNPLPDFSRYPLTTTVPVLLMAVIAAPVTEEIAFRGYCQSMLERVARPITALLLAAVLFALAHFPQGLEASKLLVYFLTGLVFGTMAYFTDSILPSLIVHVIGDTLFFTLIWPNDAGRTLITVAGPDASFWINLGQAIVFSVFAGLAFLWVYRSSGGASRRVVALGG
jgi:membrane protease YdiL (CAAX protease family)